MADDAAPCARVSLSVSSKGRICTSGTVLQWSFLIGTAQHRITLTAALKKRQRDIEFDGEPLSLSDGVAHKDEKRSRFEWKRHGHNFALEERLDVPKRTEAARRFCLSIDGTPFQVGDGGCAAEVRVKNEAREDGLGDALLASPREA